MNLCRKCFVVWDSSLWELLHLVPLRFDSIRFDTAVQIIESWYYSLGATIDHGTYSLGHWPAIRCSHFWIPSQWRSLRWKEEWLPNRAVGIDSGSISVFYVNTEIGTCGIVSFATRDILNNSARLVETIETICTVGIFVAITFAHSKR